MVGNLICQTIYDGKDLLTYSAGSPYAMTNPMLDAMSDMDKDTKKNVINSQNPVFWLFDWKNCCNMFQVPSDDKPVFINNKAVKNGFKCRLIKFNEEKEACINDKTGIAVYQKLVVDDIRKPGEKQETTLDIVKIDNTEIPDSTFDLPNGVRKMNMDDMLNNISNMLK